MTIRPLSVYPMSSLAIVKKALENGYFHPLDDTPWDKAFKVPPGDLEFMHSAICPDDDELRERIGEARTKYVSCGLISCRYGSLTTA